MTSLQRKQFDFSDMNIVSQHCVMRDAFHNTRASLHETKESEKQARASFAGICMLSQSPRPRLQLSPGLEASLTEYVCSLTF